MKFLSLAVVGLMAVMADGSQTMRGARQLNNNGNNNGNNNANNNANNNYNQQANGQGQNNNGGNYENQNYDEEMEEQDNYYADVYPVSSNNKLKFSQCVSLKTQNNNLLMDNIVAYAADGVITSIRSFVLFDMCQKDNCARDQSNPMASTFMVDLDTYLDSMVEAAADEDYDEYCNACETYSNDCNIDYYNQNGQYDQNGQYNNGQRHLNNVKAIDCNKCYALGCFDDYLMEQQGYQRQQNGAYGGYGQNQDADQDMEIDQGEVAEWVEEISSCVFTNTYWQNIGLYAGWLCNGDGTGVQVGLFLDNRCRMYHSELSYANVIDEDTYWTMLGSSKVIPAMFASTVDCADDQDNAEYVSKYEYQMYMANNGGQNNNANYDNDGDYDFDGVSEVCQNIFDGDNFKAKSIGNCGDPVNYNDYMVDNYYHYDWYTYDLNRTSSWDQSAICNTVAQKFMNGQLTQSNVVYQNGTFFNYTDYSAFDGYNNSDAYLFDEYESEHYWWKNSKNGKGGAKYNSNKGGNNVWNNAADAGAKMAPWAVLLIVLVSVAVTIVVMVRFNIVCDCFCCYRLSFNGMRMLFSFLSSELLLSFQNDLFSMFYRLWQPRRLKRW